MSIDSKSTNLLPSDGIALQSEPSLSLPARTGTSIAASLTRATLFFSIFAFCLVCGYEYATGMFSPHDSIPPGWVGLLLTVLALTEVTIADYADRLPFRYRAQAASLPYGFFVLGGLVATCLLLLFEFLLFIKWNFGGNMMLHLMISFVSITIVLGLAIMWRSINDAGERLMDIMENI